MNGGNVSNRKKQPPHVGTSVIFCSTLLTEFGTALTTILHILFQYCYKYCYSDSQNL